MHANKTLFGLIRHAPTKWNIQKRIQGRRNSPLTPQGRQLSEDWGKKLQRGGWEKILTSDLGRALETVEGINRTLHLPVYQDFRLREQHWGNWTGRTIPGLRQSNAEELSRLESSGWHFRPPNGESRLELWERGRAALKDAAERWPAQKIIVVTHEGIIKAVLYRLLKRQFLPEETDLLKSYHLHTVETDRESICIKTVNTLDLRS